MPPIDPFFLTPSEPPSPGNRTCSNCGYDCRGIGLARPCPECGHEETPAEAPLAVDAQESSGRAPRGIHPGGLTCPRCGTSTQGLPIGALCAACAKETPGRSQQVSHDDGSVPCVVCGYDRRATPAAMVCPECGAVPEAAVASQSVPGAVSSPLSTRSARSLTSNRLPPQVAMSWMFRTGTSLALAATLGLIAVGVLSMTGVLAEDSDYREVLLLVALAGAFSVWLVTPSTLDVGFKGWLVARWAVRLLTPCWVAGLWLWDVSGPVWQPWTLVLELLGLIGLIVTMFVYETISVELELRATARRFATTGWLWMPAALLAWLGPFPERTLVLPDSPVGMIGAIFVLIVIGPWFWMLGRTARSLQDIRRLRSWTRRHHREAEARVEARRERLEQASEQQRP